MADIRRGDLVEVFDGVAEVQSVVANNEGLLVTLLVAESRDKLSLNVLRAGGPDEREDDKDVRPEEVHEERKAAEAVETEVEADEEDDVDESDEDEDDK